jgi:hypothetical protein
VDLDTVEQVRLQHRPHDVAHLGVVVAEAGEALAGVEVEVGPAGCVIQMRTLRVGVALVEPDDSQYLDE